MKVYQKRVDDWIREFGVRYFDVKTNGLLLAEEVGELEEEMADVLFVLCCLANQLEVDLEKAFTDNMEKKTNRDRKRHVQNDKLKGPE